LFTSCSKNDALPDPYPADSLGKINRWTLDSMRRFYYWNEQIPSKPDHSLSPELFFKSLLSSSDRFSHISGPNVPPATNSYFSFGFHYALLQVPGYNYYIGVVTFVNINGAADRAGLRRGSYFMKVNGRQIDAQNLAEINRQLNEKGTVTLTAAVFNNNAWEPGTDIPLSPGYSRENPVYYTRIFTKGSTKTGYLYYTSFDESFDGNLLEAFRKFKEAGISELVLDLRYNAGGSVASSAKLAAMIADKLGRNSVYAIYEGNRRLGRRGRTLQEVLQTSGSNAGKNYDDLQALNLHMSRVFMLTTRATASAAELIINNLRPYLEVIQIGETTTGKDEASFLISDLRNPKQVFWELHPIVYKLFNSNNQGAYSQGLAPAHQVSELATLPLQPVGQAGDPLVYRALQLIYGSNIPGAPTNLRERQPAAPCTPVFNSATALARTGPPVSVQY
jgi:C-terminal processing protease CtpA/Prc